MSNDWNSYFKQRPLFTDVVKGSADRLFYMHAARFNIGKIARGKQGLLSLFSIRGNQASSRCLDIRPYTSHGVEIKRLLTLRCLGKSPAKSSLISFRDDFRAPLNLKGGETARAYL